MARSYMSWEIIETAGTTLQMLYWIYQISIQLKVWTSPGATWKLLPLRALKAVTFSVFVTFSPLLVILIYYN